MLLKKNLLSKKKKNQLVCLDNSTFTNIV